MPFERIYLIKVDNAIMHKRGLNISSMGSLIYSAEFSFAYMSPITQLQTKQNVFILSTLNFIRCALVRGAHSQSEAG